MPFPSPTKVATRDVPPSRRQGAEVRILLTPGRAPGAEGFSGTMLLAPGECLSEHYHPYSDEFLYAVSGRIRVRVDGEPIGLEPGDALLIRRGQRHRMDNAGDEEAFLVFHICPLAPSPELGHVDTEPVPEPAAPPPSVAAPGSTAEVPR
ncbi:cupin domain-containing protein [Streptomyces sp. NRRL B-1347]|uniref:cupin domain-containing protein n=1 Tax=Streptomyces sp. NRRL B-1347 TaxID=1476877 RepID=UPI0006918C1B|nr:cupin domain-containing protein [Streptomyces sp. NRRL B-1347]